MGAPRPVRFRFGRFELDVDAGKLYCEGSRINIQGKPFAFLAVLLEKHGELVTREEIASRLWPDTHVLIDQGLNAAMRKVRVALGDTATSPAFVETLGSRGYRFISGVDITRSELACTQGMKTVAVLRPSGGIEESHLARGFHADLAVRLGKLNPQLTFIATSLNRNSHLHTVAFAVSCNLQRSGNTIHLTAELLRNPDKAKISSAMYESTLSELPALIDTVSQQLTTALTSWIKLSTASRKASSGSFVYEEYLRGRYFWNQRSINSLQKSMKSLERAIEMDPTFGAAYAALADVHNTMASYGIEEPQTAYSKALDLAGTALQFSPGLAEALVPRGWAKLSLHHNFRGAHEDIRSAAESNPSFAFAHEALGYLHLSRGKPEAALTAILRARELDPLSLPASVFYANALYYSGKFSDCIEHCMRMLELEPRFAMMHALLGLSLIAEGNHTRGVEELATAAEDSSGSAMLKTLFAYGLTRVGNYAQARELIERATPQQHLLVPSYFLACCHGAAGEHDQAAQWFQRAFEERSHWVMFADLDPKMKDLLSHPVVATVLQQVRAARLA